MRIDAHVHYMPPMTPEELAQFCREEPYWGLLVAPDDDGKSVQGWATADRMIEDMDRAGIDRVVIQGEYRLTHQACIERNNQALALIRRWPDRLMAFAVLQPAAGQRALDELQRCLDGGLRGVGELNPYAQGHTLDDADFLRLVEACIDFDIPLNLHANEEVGRFYPGKSATPLRHYYRLACRYPELKLILAHWGGGLFFYEIMPQVRRDLGNVWYDTAASPLLYPTSDIFRTALGCVDHRKVLYGSDYPLLLYPRQQQQPDFRPFLEQIGGLDLNPQVRADIMGGNAAHLLGLPVDGDGAMEPEARQGQAPTRTDGLPLMTGEVPGEPSVGISGFMAVSMVADNWPETRYVFERYHIPWRDSPVPFWEPVVQAAAAQGWGPEDQRRLLDELNEVIE